MSVVPAAHPSDSSPPETVLERFRRLEEIWLAETGYSSSSTLLRSHPAFLEIVNLGDPVVPFMLADLEERPRLWVWALPQITGADPVPAEDRGNIAKMSAAWVRWGREHGYQW
jgi:hypothetical protein